MQLNPSENFIIARQLEDSADINTYFIRAVIKDANNITIETIDLVDRGSQFFSKAWIVCPDTVGNGRWITIQSYVYTDAAYTTLSTLYGTRLDSYLVQQRTNAGLALGGGGADISYKRITDIFSAKINEVIKKIPEPKDVDLSAIIKLIKTIPLGELEDSILSAIRGIEIPEPEKVDLSPVISSLGKIQSGIDRLPMIQKEENDNIRINMASLEKTIGMVNEDVKRSPLEISRIGKELSVGIREAQSQFIEQTKQELARVIPLIIVNMFQKTIDEMSNAMPDAAKETIKEETKKESKFKNILR